MPLLLTLFGLSPLYNNLLVTILTIVYVFSLVALMELFVTKFKLARDLSRKITHIGAGTIIIFFPLFDDSDWSKYLNISILAIWTVLLIQKGLFADETDDAVKTMTRTGDRRELLRGPLYFVIVAIICGTLYYKTFAGVVAMATLGWGDGFAPIIGTRIGKMKYKILSNKTLEGSLAMFVAGFLASLFFVWLIIPSEFNLNRILIIAVIATIAEAVSPKELDNFLIPISVVLASLLI